MKQIPLVERVKKLEQTVECLKAIVEGQVEINRLQNAYNKHTLDIVKSLGDGIDIAHNALLNAGKEIKT